MVECWDPNADKRPSFEQIVVRLEEVVLLLPLHIHTFTKDNDSCCSVS